MPIQEQGRAARRFCCALSSDRGVENFVPRRRRLRFSAIDVLRLMLAWTAVSVPIFAQSGGWAWWGGSGAPAASLSGVYGIQGTPASSSVPGGRAGTGTWTDHHGNLWLFGGVGADANGRGGYLNDLWEFSTLSDQWTWVAGNSTVTSYPSGNYGRAGVYGALGVSASSNLPGSRQYPLTWLDTIGNLWLFGGYGFDSNGNVGTLSDMWEYSPSTSQWTWISGSNIDNQPGQFGPPAISALTNYPGARNSAVGWTDSSGNLWMFGGNNNGRELSDLWKFNPATYEWAWMGGSQTFNQLNNVSSPGARDSASAWTDSSGNFWLFGGTGYSASEPSEDGYLNDLWEFAPLTNQWTLISGSTASGQSGAYGVQAVSSSFNAPGGRYSASSWIDPFGNLWLFGGFGYDSAGKYGPENDLWEFTQSSWTWVAGSNVTHSGNYQCTDNGTVCGQVGVCGALGTPSPTNSPGGRSSAATGWLDRLGDPWLLGGGAFDCSPQFGDFADLNDMWQFIPEYTGTQSSTTVPIIGLPAGTYSSPQPVSISDSTPNATIFYTTDGTTPGVNSLRYSGQLNVAANQTLQAVAIAPGDTVSGIATASYTILQSVPTITLAIATHHSQDLPFAVNAASNSSSAISYSVLSGPATISGNTVTVTGGGTVVIQASQAAAGNFIAGSQTASFQVIAGSVWFGSFQTSDFSLNVLDLRGVAITNSSGYTASNLGIFSPAEGIAFDGLGDAWTATGWGLTEFSPHGALLTLSPILPCSNTPTGVAVDGAGQVWLACNGALYQYSNASVELSPSRGFSLPNSATRIAIDTSGSVWATSSGNTVTRLLGAAAPVVSLTTAASTGAGVRP